MGNTASRACDVEKCDRQKHAFGDHGRKPHQPVNQHRHEHGDESQNHAHHRQEMQTEQEDQRVIRDGNSATGQKQSKAQAQKDGKQLFHENAVWALRMLKLIMSNPILPKSVDMDVCTLAAHAAGF